MHHLVTLTFAALGLVACAGSQPANSPTVEPAPDVSPAVTTEPEAAPVPEAGATPEAAPKDPDAQDNTFVLQNSDSAKGAHGATESKIKPTKTEAALKFIVIDKDKGPVKGVVISLTGPDGKKYYTEETDTEGYAEVLAPVGQKYELVYLSLGRRDIAATVPVTDEPNQNVKLTLRYKGRPLEPGAPPRFVLKGINFDTNKATIRPESFPALESVVEYLTHKKSSHIEISGHTDNVGSSKANKLLSERRAKACRDYLISKGIDGSRIDAVGYGDERPVASNTNDEGRQKNRRIEAIEKQ